MYNIGPIENSLKSLSPKLNVDIEPIEFLFAIIFIVILAIVLDGIINFIIFIHNEKEERKHKSLETKTKEDGKKN